MVGVGIGLVGQPIAVVVDRVAQLHGQRMEVLVRVIAVPGREGINIAGGGDAPRALGHVVGSLAGAVAVVIVGLCALVDHAVAVVIDLIQILEGARMRAALRVITVPIEFGISIAIVVDVVRTLVDAPVAVVVDAVGQLRGVGVDAVVLIVTVPVDLREAILIPVVLVLSQDIEHAELIGGGVSCRVGHGDDHTEGAGGLGHERAASHAVDVDLTLTGLADQLVLIEETKADVEVDHVVILIHDLGGHIEVHARHTHIALQRRGEDHGRGLARVVDIEQDAGRGLTSVGVGHPGGDAMCAEAEVGLLEAGVAIRCGLDPREVAIDVAGPRHGEALGVRLRVADVREEPNGLARNGVRAILWGHDLDGRIGVLVHLLPTLRIAARDHQQCRSNRTPAHTHLSQHVRSSQMVSQGLLSSAAPKSR